MKMFKSLVLIIICARSFNAQWYVPAGDVTSFLLNLISSTKVLTPLYPQPLFTIKDTYDYIIIGASPSGAALANRLTENPNVNVLLLENGEEASDLTDVPALAANFDFSNYSYGYKTEPQEGFCRGCIDQNMYYVHGKALGGSTVINIMIWSRGNRRDYDRWAALGNPGWSFDDMSPYFKKIEDCKVNIIDEEYRGKGGYITVSDIKFRSGIANAFVDACMESGYNYVDPNGKEQMGVTYLQASIRDGKRCSAEKGYLRPAKDRPNLTILTNARATKILIDSNKAAYGVKYFRYGLFKSAFATKEVILSAGVLNSPQVLMLSGIGPADHLNSMGIPVIKDLPVGKKLYDHPSFPLTAFHVNESIVINAYEGFLNPINYVKFAQGEGVLTSPGGTEALAFFKSSASTDPDPMYPDIEFQFMGGGVTSDSGTVYRKMFNIPPETYDIMYKPFEGKNVYMVTPILLHPRSYGTVELRSKNPFDSPRFKPNLFSDPENHDIKTFIAGIRELQRIHLSPALQRYDAKMIDIPVPNCKNEIFNSDEYLECALRSIIATYWHMVATCRMGPANDPEAVVDNELRVYGIKYLRVADTSVIPFPPSSHNSAPGYAIGEKAADLIKDCWKV